MIQSTPNRFKLDSTAVSKMFLESQIGQFLTKEATIRRMSQLNPKDIVYKANFHGKFVAVGRVFASKAQLWKNVAEVANQSMPFYNKAVLERNIVELQQFLILKALSGDVDATILSPSSDVDEVWHVFLLFTREYAEVCGEALTAAGHSGGLIHHNPMASLPGDEVNKNIRYQNTRALYQAVFPHQIPLNIWPVSYTEGGSPSNVASGNSSSTGSSSSTPIAMAVPVIPSISVVSKPVRETEVTLNLSMAEFPDRIAHCKVKGSVKLQKVFDDFMDSVRKFDLNFYLRGQQLQGTKSVESLQWTDNDTIVVRH